MYLACGKVRDMDLFQFMEAKNKDSESPLASRMRPTSIEEVVGQEHILQYFDELDDSGRKKLAAQIKSIDWPRVLQWTKEAMRIWIISECKLMNV